MATDRHASSSPPTEGDNLFLDILHEAPIFARRKSTTVLWSLIYCILLVGYAVVAAAAPSIFHPVRKLAPSLLCSCDAILLLVTGIFQQCLAYQVKKIRLQLSYKWFQRGTILSIIFLLSIYMAAVEGYYNFSQKLKHIVRLPFAVTAYGTAAMLLVMVWKLNTDFLSDATLLRIIMLVQAVCSGSFMAVYIGYVHQYNSLDSQPDVLKSLYSPLQPSSSLEGLRYYDGNRLSDQQMALLQYQRENLHFMSEEILRLQELVSKYERSNDGRTPQVDLAHLLATRDQELRTLTAETNQLHSELKLARSLIAERDTEIQRVNNTNSQYIEENERLRAILGEWSARAAKLERALEMERVSNIEYQKKIASFKNQLRLSPDSPDR